MTLDLHNSKVANHHPTKEKLLFLTVEEYIEQNTKFDSIKLNNLVYPIIIFFVLHLFIAIVFIAVKIKKKIAFNLKRFQSYGKPTRFKKRYKHNNYPKQTY